ncbi:MAG: hypothetical protein ACYC1Q_13885, partial [Bacteroidia bacterium]
PCFLVEVVQSKIASSKNHFDYFFKLKGAETRRFLLTCLISFTSSIPPRLRASASNKPSQAIFVRQPLGTWNLEFGIWNLIFDG